MTAAQIPNAPNAPNAAPRGSAKSAFRSSATSAQFAPTSLEELLLLDPPTLKRLYEDARVPRLSDVTGPLRGRMLALPAVKGRLARAIRRLASSDRFP